MSPASNLLRNGAEFLNDAAGESTDAHLQAFEIVDRIDLLAEPAAHLTAGIPGEQRGCVVLLVELVEHFFAATQREPTLIQPLVRSEGDRRAEGESRVFAEVVIRGGMTALDGAVLYGIDDLQAGNDFAGGENLDLEFVIGRVGDGLGHDFRSAVKRIERLRPARGHAPFEFRHRLRDRRRSNRGSGNTDARRFSKIDDASC